jgi:uncharacterized protein YlxP (DUF503 family)
MMGDSPNAVSTPVRKAVTLEDVMTQVISNGRCLAEMRTSLDEIQGAIHTLEVENEQLREEVKKLKEREEVLKDEVAEAKYAASVAMKKVNESDQYQRRNNLRIFGIKEEDEEDEEDIEKKVLTLFNNTLQVTVKSSDIEAVHRLGNRDKLKDKLKNKGNEIPPRGVIVRFVNRKHRELVIKNRKQLKGKKTVIVEDLTNENYRLYQKVKEDELCKQAWTTAGKIMMQTVSGRVVRVHSSSHLQEKREVWAKPPPKKFGNK